MAGGRMEDYKNADPNNLEPMKFWHFDVGHFKITGRLGRWRSLYTRQFPNFCEKVFDLIIDLFTSNEVIDLIISGHLDIHSKARLLGSNDTNYFKSFTYDYKSVFHKFLSKSINLNYAKLRPCRKEDAWDLYPRSTYLLCASCLLW